MRRPWERAEWKFFAALPHGGRALAAAWWAALLLRGILPAALAVAMGALIGSVQRGDPLARPLAAVGVVFVLLQVLHADTPGGERQPRAADWPRGSTTG